MLEQHLEITAITRWREIKFTTLYQLSRCFLFVLFHLVSLRVVQFAQKKF